MGLPEEDRGPGWLRDWGSKTGFTELDSFSGYVDSNALAVDIRTLVAFADALEAEHEQDYRPHVREVYEGMMASPAGPDARFIELTEAMTHHRDMLVQTSTALTNHDKAITAFVAAARTISAEYRGADALSAAKVGDVESNLAPPVSSTGTGTTTTATPVVTPEQAAAQTPEEQPAETPTTTNTTTTGSPDNGREIS
jgi:hypothetical protein